jgi:glycosyltransferase involved in cell wall biosynthesis
VVPKVAHFIYDDVLNPWVGGGGAHRTKEIYKRFPREWDITIFTGNYPGAVDGGGYRRLGFSGGYLLSRLSYCLFAQIIRNKYDLVVEDFSAHSPIYRGNICVVQNLYSPLRPGWRTPVERAMKIIHNNFVAVSRHIAAQLPSASVVYNGISEDMFGRSTGEDYILFLGRLDIYQKGIDTLLSAYAKSGVGLPLKIVGDGKDRTKVERLSSGVARVVGRMSRNDALSGCAFVVMPSRFESWGMVAIEAGAMGKAVLATDIPGLNEAVVDGDTGLLVSGADGLSAGIRLLTENNELRHRLGRNGRIRAKDFLWDKIAIKKRLIYEGLLA